MLCRSTESGEFVGVAAVCSACVRTVIKAVVGRPACDDLITRTGARIALNLRLRRERTRAPSLARSRWTDAAFAVRGVHGDGMDVRQHETGRAFIRVNNYDVRILCRAAHGVESGHFLDSGREGRYFIFFFLSFFLFSRSYVLNFNADSQIIIYHTLKVHFISYITNITL